METSAFHALDELKLTVSSFTETDLVKRGGLDALQALVKGRL